MAGTMPSTALLLTRGGTVVGEFISYADLGLAVGISVTDDGIVMLGEDPQSPTYIYDPTGKNRNAFRTKREIIADWTRCYFRDRSYRIYRYLI